MINLNQDGAEEENKDVIETTSDISSVELDSDDSCFAATVEIIKLAPVKKRKDALDGPSVTGVKGMDRMPSTTNVSQNDDQMD